MLENVGLGLLWGRSASTQFAATLVRSVSLSIRVAAFFLVFWGLLAFSSPPSPPFTPFASSGLSPGLFTFKCGLF